MSFPAGSSLGAGLPGMATIATAGQGQTVNAPTTTYQQPGQVVGQVHAGHTQQHGAPTQTTASVHPQTTAGAMQAMTIPTMAGNIQTINPSAMQIQQLQTQPNFQQHLAARSYFSTGVM